MKRRRETTNRSFKFEGSWKKFNALLDIAELRYHEFLSQKSPSELEAKKLPRLRIGDDQTPRKKRSSLRTGPKKKIIGSEVSQKTQLVLPGFNVDWVVVVKVGIKEKEKLQKQQKEENSSSSSSGEAVRLRPEIPDLNSSPPPSCDDEIMTDISD